MKPSHTDRLEERSTTERLEGLLRHAAEYEPEAAPPDALVSGAMARLKQDRPVHRPRPRATSLLAGILVAGGALTASLAGALWATLLPSRSAVPVRETRRAPEPSVARPVRPLPRDPESPVRRDTAVRLVASHVAEPPVSRPVARKKRVRRPAPPIARWEIERVRQEPPSVVMAGWVVESDETSHEWVLTPGLLHVPVAGAPPAPTSDESGFVPDGTPASTPAAYETEKR
jgi:hypothetical protein